MRNARIQEQRLAEVTRRRIEALVGASEDDPAPGVEVPQIGSAGDPGPGRHARRPVPATGRLLAWVADRLPAGLRGTVHLGSAQLGVVALVVATGLVLTAWWMVRSSGDQQAVVPPRPASLAPMPDVDETADPATEVSTVVVDVAGRVRRPGIAELPAGSRVVDALEAAGGVRRGVDLATLNLARVLVDGEQVLVGTDAGGAASGTGQERPAGSPALVSINTADQETLESLPGVGPVTAAAILAWREEHGAFAALEELLEVSGIGPATLAELMPHITL